MLIGRDRELATFERLMAGLGERTPFVLSLTGAPGSGRSSLAEGARRTAARHGSFLLAARGMLDGAELAYSGLTTLLRPLDGQLDGLAGDLANPLRAALAMRRDHVDALDVRMAVLRVITGVAETQPLTVILDDADRLDASTIDVLRFALGRLGVDRVGAVAVSLEGMAPLEAVTTHRMNLGPLRTDILGQIVSAALDCSPEAALACSQWADGNALVAIELARSLNDDERSGRLPLPSVPRPTNRVVESMMAELGALSTAVQRALVVSAADRSGSVDVVRRALALLGEGPDGLDEAESAGFVTIDDGRLRFSRTLLRPLSYRLVAAPSRRAAHRALAGALLDPHQAVERAFQLVSSCAGPDDEVAAMLELVATDAARRGAIAESAAVFERAAHLSVDHDLRQLRLRGAAFAHLDVSAFDDAIRVAEESASSGDADAALIVVEAVEKRDGPEAAVTRFDQASMPAAVLSDLLLAGGRSEAARAALVSDGLARAEALEEALRAAFTGDGVPASEVFDDRDPLERRARRRWMHVMASRGIPPAGTSTIEELLATTIAAEATGRRDDAIRACTRAVTLLPSPSSAIARSLASRLEALESLSADPLVASLTPAERRVAEAVADGRTNREAADQLYLSVKTVDFHLQSVYRKLGVRSRTELSVRLTRGDRR